MDDPPCSSSSSSFIPRPIDVFLSFRGADTRHNFVSHLNGALQRAAVKMFIDSADIQKGENISTIFKAIEESKISVIVFSENYATSKWCLMEVVKIMKCTNDPKHKQTVIPIFYKVEPSHFVYGEHILKAFEKHESRYEQEFKTWKSALAEVCGKSGWTFKENEDDEYNFVEKIVKDVLNKLLRMSPTTTTEESNFVGLENCIEKMKLGLPLQMDSVRKIGITGMGGIGKTTIATKAYQLCKSSFDNFCYVSNVKDNKKGTVSLLKNILCRLLNQKIQINTLGDGYERMKGLSNRKVLVVLDDVDHRSEIDTLLGGASFGGGSRIIVTTRRSDILDGFEEHKAEFLSESDALKLFSQYAFKTDIPSNEFEHLSQRVVRYTGRLPLALKVIGSLLACKKSAFEWEMVLDKMKVTPNSEILDVLRISYDGLDDLEQKIFLDIACFFRGKTLDYVTEILDGCGFHPHVGIKSLVDRSLITITGSRWNGDPGDVEMHDLLQEMGRHVEIGREENGNRRRFWSEDDVVRMLNNTKDTASVECLIAKFQNKEVRHFRAEALEDMRKLRLLKFTDTLDHEEELGKYQVIEDLRFLSQELRVLVWRRCPLKYLPSTFDPKYLWKLKMRDSCIEYVWEGSKLASNLTSIDLDGCRSLKVIPDVTGLPNLKKLILVGCSCLTEIHPSVFAHKNIESLILERCRELRILPSTISMKSLPTLDLSDSKKVEYFPEVSEEMDALEDLNLEGTAVKELPSSIDRFRKLLTLNLSDCSSLISLPDSICNLAQLKKLDLSGCSKLCGLPENIGNLQSLWELQLSDCRSLISLPDNICNLAQLESLDLRGCSKLCGLPENIGNLQSLWELQLSDCRSLISLPDSVCHLAKLKQLDLSGCSELCGLPENIGNLQSLWELHLSGSGIKKLPDSVQHLENINWFDVEAPFPPWPSSSIGDCSPEGLYVHLMGRNLLELSNAITNYKSVRVLKLSYGSFDYLPSIMIELTFLERLEVDNCWRLRSIPELSTSISYINAYYCRELESVSTPQTSPYHVSRCFNFSNCMNLKPEYLFRNIVETHLPPQGNPCQPFNSICVGSDIPKQFTQVEGSCLSVQLPPNWFSNKNTKKFTGFAVCAVIRAQSPDLDNHFSVQCVCTFKGDRCMYRFSFYLFDNKNELAQFYGLRSYHLLVGYVPWSELGIHDGEEGNARCYTEAKFEIKSSDDDITSERCGVRFFFGNNEQNVEKPRVQQVDNSERRGSIVPCISHLTSDTSDKDEQQLDFRGENRPPTDEDDGDLSEPEVDIGLRETGVWRQVRTTSGLKQGVLDDGYNYSTVWSVLDHRFKCICVHKPRCRARALMETSINDPTIMKVIYVGRHTCWKHQPMLTFQVRVKPGVGIASPPADGFIWKEWDKPRSSYPRRTYYVCSPLNHKACMAIKEVRCSEDEKILQITYRLRHTCTLPSPNTVERAESSTRNVYDHVADDGTVNMLTTLNLPYVGSSTRNVIHQDDQVAYDGTVNMLTTLNLPYVGSSTRNVDDQIFLSLSLPVDNPVVNDSVDMLPDLNSPYMEHFHTVAERSTVNVHDQVADDDTVYMLTALNSPNVERQCCIIV